MLPVTYYTKHSDIFIGWFELVVCSIVPIGTFRHKFMKVKWVSVWWSWKIN